MIGESGVVPAPDVVTALDLQNGPDGVRLTNGEAIVDLAGWGEPLFQEYYEGSPAEDVESGCSLARSPDCFDHDDNRIDFASSPVPTPGSRNSPEVDLSITPVHPGQVIFEAGHKVTLDFVVANEGALTVEGHSASVSLRLDGDLECIAMSVLQETLAPRDTARVEVVLSVDRGYHRALASLETPNDCEPANDAATTSFTVGGAGGQLKLNEVMYSPSEGEGEWLEFQNVTAGTVNVVGWFLGDDEEQSRLASMGDVETLLPPGTYLVATKDSVGGDGAHPCVVVKAGTWEALSADDVVVLLDEFGTPVERVSYDDSWGGGRGVSLERVSTDVSGETATNWGSCVSAAGATPCAPNSILLPFSSGEGRLFASPNPFTPDGDGDGDRTLIAYRLPMARSTLRVSVYDARGRKRAVLADHSASPSEGEFLWDGTDDGGMLLPSGMYVVRLEAIAPREGVLVDEKMALGLLR